MAGGLLIGWWAGDRINNIMPLFNDLFQGILALFLLKMGITAAQRFAGLKVMDPFIVQHSGLSCL